MACGVLGNITVGGAVAGSGAGGMCEQVCVTPKASIFVLPREIGLGSSNEQYVKGWVEGADKKLKDAEPKEFKTDEKKLNDYLNSGDLL